MAGTAPTSSDCVAYWKMEDLTDATGNGWTMSATGATSGATGIVDDCYSLDGTNDYLSASNMIGTGWTAISINFWFKSSKNTRDFPWSFRDNAAFRAILIENSNSTAGDIRVLFYYDGSNQYDYSDNSQDWTDGNWHMVTVTANESDGEVKTYIDGSLKNTGNAGTFDLDNFTGMNCVWGYQHWAPDRYFQGNLDEMSVFKSVLSDNNITYLYNSGSPGTAQQYPFSGTPTTTTYDSILHGTNF